MQYDVPLLESAVITWSLSTIGEGRLVMSVERGPADDACRTWRVWLSTLEGFVGRCSLVQTWTADEAPWFMLPGFSMARGEMMTVSLTGHGMARTGRLRLGTLLNRTAAIGIGL